mmetsp:Transcript_9658/g.23980  ORF Transcript_9658/g.23980 Transcript_9658/m.23980 type:complete len:400 (-) Transcript_9658:1135-2334(-)|eukprot:CAMPEP_0202869198 /NCGR_PEP_ID=MMETSP1391-20130828/12136_1 /ASSEMBLY_ACC=CAM_ASM_000867 /TAXON_ID=1034604 /ORGANISM="Chlamydomonas leiostraca, Strain SAG 11-49" /LENGTH=399 /DNA_ID=CAMNT_0049549481 /DNA_START=158 /DNA_END=1357 /DNA_ORIENTATION=+
MTAPAALDGFVVVCVPKSLELGGDHHLHRATKAQELKEELEHLVSGHTGEGASQAAVRNVFQEGGGIAAIGCSEEVVIASVGDAIAVFQGQLKNLEQLVAAHHPTASHYFITTVTDHSCRTVEETPLEGADAEGVLAKSPPKPSLMPTPVMPNAAEMVLHLYASMGIAMLMHLRGRFSFALYDAKQMRVLAARDGGGSIPLLQAHTQRDSLVIASRPDLVQGCKEVIDFQPGFFKYGWHAEPRRADPAELTGGSRGGSRRSSIDQGHGGHTHGRSGSRRSSMDAGHGGGGPARRGSIDAGHGHGGQHSPAQGNSRRPSLDHYSAWHSSGHQGGSTGAPGGGNRRSSVDRHSNGWASPLTPQARSPAPSAAAAQKAAEAMAADLHNLHLRAEAKPFVPTH